MRSSSRFPGLAAFLLSAAAIVLWTAGMACPASALQGHQDSNLFALDTTSASAVGPGLPAIGSDFVGRCSPNPFNPRTTIRFGVAVGGPAQLAVYDVGGRRVRVLLESPALPAGNHEVIWDGRDDGGRDLASGVYLARLQTGAGSHGTLMVLLR
jgi:hypothetical protein